jgi:hypothetical protein
MEKITFKGKEYGLYKLPNSISICDIENENLTRAFMKVIVDETGEQTVNPNFKTEVEEFAGKGFLG